MSHLTAADALSEWQTELDEVIAHLGAAIIQSISTDDQIIMDHVKSAHEILKIVRRRAAPTKTGASS